MDYEYKLISLIQKIENSDVLAFYYGLLAELTQHLIDTEKLTIPS